MIKVTFTAMAIAGLFCVTTAFADVSDIKASNNQLVFGIMSTNVDYTETGDGTLTPSGTLDTEKGRVPGYSLSISTMQDLWLGNDYIEAEYDHASGNTNYTGALCTPAGVCGAFGSYVGTSGASLTNYSARYGEGLIVNDLLMLTPYVEFAHHEWDRGVNWGELYTSNYSGIGVLGQYSPASRLVLSANALFGRTFGNNIDVTGSFSGALGNSNLYRAGAAADYAFTKNFHLNVGVDYTSFQYGISALYPLGGGYYAWEPDSKTNYTTVRIGLGYGF